ncbi:MAG: ribonuclease PH [Candidatus Omnitrophica bacterium]|nr:ribonuclease PH [Candidatus Omnitrophota bacterium]
MANPVTAKRSDGRKADGLRPVTLKMGCAPNAEGSCLVSVGSTRVFCTASVEETVPPFLRGKGTGWVSAEYAMLPRSCPTRISRASTRGKTDGRAQEIQRLIGRALRSVTRFDLLGERTVWLDCDVIQGDGGTRCAAITGAYCALHAACRGLVDRGIIQTFPLSHLVAAVSVGIVKGRACLDLCYAEDSTADVDMNIVMTSAGGFVEIQGTAEKKPFSRAAMDELTALAQKGIRALILQQKKALLIRS